MKAIVVELTTTLVLVWLLGGSVADYIRSDEILLEDNWEVGSQIINLNRLMDNEKKAGNLLAGQNYVFKMVNDSTLINYIDLKYVNDVSAPAEVAVVILKKRLNFDDVCDGSASSSTCQQTLKIVAINENDFIEIPMEIRRVLTSTLNSRIRKLANVRLSFEPTNVTLRPVTQTSTHMLDFPRLETSTTTTDELYGLIDFSVVNLNPLDDYVTVTVDRKLPNMRKFRVRVNFNSESSLLRAYELKMRLHYRIVAYFSVNATDQFDLLNNNGSTALDLTLNVDDMRILNLKPLDFEYPIYSVSIENDNIEVNDTVLEPRLKHASTTSPIVFGLILNEDTPNRTEFPFYIDESTGVIRLKSHVWTDDFGAESSNEKLFNFGIKATYRSLSSAGQEDNYYLSYMIPAFAKIQISVRNREDSYVKYPVIRSQLISPFISRYEILNEESNNQTFILYINDPFSVNSKLIKFFIDKSTLSNRTATTSGGTSLYWLFDNYESFYYDDHLTNLTMLNRIEFRDQCVYKTNIKLAERLSRSANRILAELNVQFRVDFDPLVFEKNEYKLYLTHSDLINRNLVRIKLKNRLKSIINNDKHDNVTYRLTSANDSDYFDMHTFTGWLHARRELTAKTYYELEIIAVNMDLQKSASVKCKIYVNCDKQPQLQPASADDIIRFSLFDNSPNRTQIGTFKSVCSRADYLYALESFMSVRVCSREENFNCKQFELNNQTAGELFNLNRHEGYLMTNSQISIHLLLGLIRNVDAQLNQMNFYENVNYLSVLLRGSIVNLEKTFPIEILIQNVPKIFNFNNLLVVGEKQPHKPLDSEQDDVEQDQCLFNYKYLESNLDFENPENENLHNVDVKYSLNSNLVSRFVRVDKNSAHSEADFKLSDCQASFFIYNNGCLALKHDDFGAGQNRAFNNESLLNRKCVSKNRSEAVLLRAGVYTLEFKLCFYNSNKVSCSSLYNQTVYVKSDVFRSSKLTVTSIHSKADKLELNDRTIVSLNEINGDLTTSGGLTANLNEMSIFKRSGISVYLFVLFVVITIVALIAIFSFLFLFIKPKYEKNFKTNLSEKAFVLPGSKGDNSDFKNSEVSSESSSSRTRTNSNTPETSSNAPTSSSKISKTDDESDEIVKIQVIDDYLSKNMNSMKYTGYSNNNFSYAGSFSSIGSSSYESNPVDDYNNNHHSKHQPMNRMNNLGADAGLAKSSSENDHGLYSVKTASIHFNSISQMNSHVDDNLIVSDLKEYDVFESRENLIRESLANFNQLNGTHFTPVPMMGLNPKTSSLKKLKKEIALKKSSNLTNGSLLLTSPSTATTSAHSIANSSNNSSCHHNNNNTISGEKVIYEYLNTPIVLNANDIIASVV